MDRAKMSEIWAEEAAVTHRKIKELRKAMSNKFAWQRKELEAAEQKEKDAWWQRVSQIASEENK